MAMVRNEVKEASRGAAARRGREGPEEEAWSGRGWFWGWSRWRCAGGETEADIVS